MDEKNHTSTESSVKDAIYEFISTLLAEGASPAEISFHLTAHALSLGLQLAPNAHSALATVSLALHQVSDMHAQASIDSESENDAEPSSINGDENSIVVELSHGPKTFH